MMGADRLRGEQVLRDLFAKRDPLYRATADLVVRTDRRGPRAVVNEIIRRTKRLSDPLDLKACMNRMQVEFSNVIWQ